MYEDLFDDFRNACDENAPPAKQSETACNLLDAIYANMADSDPAKEYLQSVVVWLEEVAIEN